MLFEVPFIYILLLRLRHNLFTNCNCLTLLKIIYGHGRIVDLVQQLICECFDQNKKKLLESISAQRILMISQLKNTLLIL